MKSSKEIAPEKGPVVSRNRLAYQVRNYVQ
jgi:hypothetical protein